MKLVRKQLAMEILKYKIYLIFMLLLSIFTSFMYFFVHFSIDGNMTWLAKIPILNEQQLLFQNGLISNTILARYILIAFTALTGFVFGMFFYHFFQSAGKQLGCLKALGFKDRDFILLFLKLSGGLSLLGAVIGLCSGYAASDILLLSNQQSYQVSGIVKGISPVTIVIGLFLPGAVFSFITFFMYRMIRGKEVGKLLIGIDGKSEYRITFPLANKAAGWFPEKDRLSVRLALRNPVAVLLILASVMIVSTMFIMAYSLNISSAKVFDTQIMGHYYLYETCYDKPQEAVQSVHSNWQSEADFYLTAPGIIEGKGSSIEWTIAAGDGKKEIYELMDRDGNGIAFPEYGEIVISSQIEELYGIKQGERILVKINGQKQPMKVSGIAYNAKQGWVYVFKEELCELLSLPEDSYTEIFSKENLFKGGSVITHEDKMDILERGMVSNRVSAVINQMIGCVIGCILLFLALLQNFQSSTRDILILQMMGYRKKEIGRLLIDIYKPILFADFIITLLPAVQLTKYILRSLSIEIGDYMMFQTNIFVIGGILILLYTIYFIVYSSFQIGIAKYRFSSRL